MSKTHKPGPGTGSKQQVIFIESYTKDDGTHVKAHMRTTEDNTIKNNFDVANNFDPYTGKTGTKRK